MKKMVIIGILMVMMTGCKGEAEAPKPTLRPNGVETITTENIEVERIEIEEIETEEPWVSEEYLEEVQFNSQRNNW